MADVRKFWRVPDLKEATIPELLRTIADGIEHGHITDIDTNAVHVTLVETSEDGSEVVGLIPIWKNLGASNRYMVMSWLRRRAERELWG